MRKMIVTTDTPKTEQNHKRNNHNNNNNMCDSSHHQSPRSTSTMATTAVVTEEEYIRQGCCHHNMNCRIDGRQLHEYRHYTITTTTPPNITAISTSSSSSSPLLLPYSSTAYSYGSSELYDTMTNGTLLHLICHIKAEFTTVSPSTTTTTTTPLVEISLFSNTTSSDSHKILHDYETSLQQYYVPCLRQSLEQIHTLESKPSSESSPTNTLWKLHVDVQVVSSIHTMSTTTLTSTSNTNNTSTTSTPTTSTPTTTTNSVYYLDAVTHVINAALYHTTIPLSSSSNTTIMEHMANDSQPLIPRTSGSQQHPQHDPVIVLPIIVTTHIMSIGNRTDPSSTTTTALIADASSEEANLSNVAVHMVIVPTLEYSSSSNNSSNNNNTHPQRYRTNTTTSSVSALWNTKAGTISHRTMMQCMMTTLETFVPQAYRSYHRQ